MLHFTFSKNVKIGTRWSTAIPHRPQIFKLFSKLRRFLFLETNTIAIFVFTYKIIDLTFFFISDLPVFHKL